MKLLFKIFFLSFLTLFLSACSSMGKGMVEAFFEQQDAVDTRVCEIWGKAFDGLAPFLDNRHGKLKVLMVHGVGDHLPGHSTQFVEKLAAELDLPVMSARKKNIALTSIYDKSKNLGNLSIVRLLSKDRSKELMFYELTWSAITAKQKEALAYDNSGEYSFRRAEINNLMKQFSNSTGPDPIIYLGQSREDILVSFEQAFCWMIKSEWQNLPDGLSEACAFNDDGLAKNLAVDQYAFVSHSLGSRITIDGLQRIAARIDRRDVDFKEALKHKKIPVYMMSNQLPMLQLGEKLPVVSNQKPSYCLPGGDKYEKRVLASTPIIAFSDPNDLLSYAIPQGFVEKYLDSRLCTDVTNININVAKIINAFNFGKVANPLDAHIGYATDDRVLALIAKGIGNIRASKMVNERCRWVETID
ncbi:hypothetical protein [Methyloglobulus sp.]|uniref:hypothetical protein n=1 Tax=Methyloglobulus sp. TaxID=2518622 RepID=UPI0032B73BB1